MAEAVAVDTWDARGVRLSEVASALSDLRHQSIGRTPIRTAVMTLVGVTLSDDQAYAAARALQALGRHHPARIVLLRPEADQAATLDGRAALFVTDADGHQVYFEEVRLTVARSGGPSPRFGGRALHTLRPAGGGLVRRRRPRAERPPAVGGHGRDRRQSRRRRTAAACAACWS